MAQYYLNAVGSVCKFHTCYGLVRVGFRRDNGSVNPRYLDMDCLQIVIPGYYEGSYLDLWLYQHYVAIDVERALELYSCINTAGSNNIKPDFDICVPEGVDVEIRYLFQADTTQNDCKILVSNVPCDYCLGLSFSQIYSKTVYVGESYEVNVGCGISRKVPYNVPNTLGNVLASGYNVGDVFCLQNFDGYSDDFESVVRRRFRLMYAWLAQFPTNNPPDVSVFMPSRGKSVLKVQKRYGASVDAMQIFYQLNK